MAPLDARPLLDLVHSRSVYERCLAALQPRAGLVARFVRSEREWGSRSSKSSDLFAWIPIGDGSKRAGTRADGHVR